MNRKSVSRLIFPVAVLLLGAWLVMRSAGPAPESVARQQALQSFAPAGAPGADADTAAPVGEVSLPVTVNISDIPAGVYDPNNQLDRWNRGEIDIFENDGIISQVAQNVLRTAAADLAADAQVQLAPSGPGVLAPTVGTSFDSIDFTECCGGGGNVPPDPEIAVGPDHVIAVVNVALEIYDKTGTSLVGPITFDSFMSANPTCTGVFDPNAIYDESEDRYILGIDADGTDYCLAVSQTGDPTGSWHIYSFSTGSASIFFDYPHAGVGRDAIYMGGNMFTSTFLDSRIWAFDKQAMYNGQAASFVMHNLGSNNDTPQPLNLHGWDQGTWPTSGPHYFITETGYNGADHTIWAWDDPFGTNSLTAVGTVDLNAATGVTAGMTVDTPQQTGGDLQANDWRPQDFEYRNGYGWTSMAVACNPGSGSVNCVRWAQIDLNTITVVDAGVYGSDGEYRTFPDLAVNACDDMAIGYSKSSSSMYPGVFATGRLSTDAAGTLQAETLIKSGEIEYTSFETAAPRRWGDYTEMTIDPDGVTFWYLGEYSKDTGTTSGRWGTYIASMTLGTCVPATPTPTSTPTATATNTPEPGPTSTPILPTPTVDPIAVEEFLIYLPLIVR